MNKTKINTQLIIYKSKDNALAYYGKKEDLDNMHDISEWHTSFVYCNKNKQLHTVDIFRYTD